MKAKAARQLSKAKKAIPFAIDPHDKAGYAQQLADSIRRAIASGSLKVGGKLPSWDEMSAALGVSRRIPREAMKILSREGWVVSRPRLGTVVAEGKMPRRTTWNPPVLFVHYDTGSVSYYADACCSSFARQLMARGYPVIPIGISRKKNGGFDFRAVAGVKGCVSSLVVNMCSHSEIREWCEGLGIPVLQSSPGTAKCRQKMLRSFVRRCLKSGIRNVVEVECFPRAGEAGVCKALSDAGITVTTWLIPPTRGIPYLEGVRLAAERAFSRRLAEGRDWLPDLFFFADDYLAQGAFLSLAAAGVEIPEDVKVVSSANEGNRPLWRQSVAMFLYDPAASGEALAESALDILSVRNSRPLVEVSFNSAPRYIQGDTFPS